MRHFAGGLKKIAKTRDALAYRNRIQASADCAQHECREHMHADNT